MKIGISLITSAKNSVGPDNVSFNLISELLDIDKETEYTIFVNKFAADRFGTFRDQLDLVALPFVTRHSTWVFENLFFNLRYSRKALDLLHFPLSEGVLGYRDKFIMTVHDLRPYLRPDLVQFRRHLRTRILLKKILPKASMIIAVSKYTRDKIIQHFSVPAEKVCVIYNGIDERFTPMPRLAGFRSRYRLPRKYILFVGETHPNKNLSRAIEAFNIARSRHQLKHHFVIAGSAGADHDNLKSYAKRNSLDHVIHFLGYFPNEDLPYLYCSSSLFVYVSLDEGFGIPPLEAMSCGIPVVASDCTALPEVLGESAILVNPYSVDAIADGIEKTLLDNSIRQHLIRKGFDRVKRFRWRKTAVDTLKVYEYAVSKTP